MEDLTQRFDGADRLVVEVSRSHYAAPNQQIVDTVPLVQAERFTSLHHPAVDFGKVCFTSSIGCGQ